MSPEPTGRIAGRGGRGGRRARFRDRRDAGEELAPFVEREVRDDPEVVVLALPRGGVPVAAPVADRLHAPLDVLVVRKLGHPQQPEFGLGAVSEGGVQLVDDALLRRARLRADDLAPVVERETAEVARRLARYREGRAGIEVAGRTVVLVDDGVATGGSARAAIAVTRARGAARVVLAVPVAAPEAVAALTEELEVADPSRTDDAAPAGGTVVAVYQPTSLRAVGAAYDDFRQTTDGEVVELLRSRRWST